MIYEDENVYINRRGEARPNDDRPSQGSHPYNILLLHSEDGQDHAYAILYPADWSAEKADQLAIEAFTEGQKSCPAEWTWDDLEPELEARGFIVTNWHHGPIWDEQRVPVKDTNE